ncbi:OmpA family protein [Hydrogenophaga sp.]|uniref:OmpA family protein n=1 Tax=Hydrogenophaga sp. TaxID=1904254 RepID=UPI003F6D3BAC
MTAPFNRFAWTGLLSLALVACSSPPQPPTVDESQKRPANAQMAVELQVCKNDLQNTRILATESSRLAETTAATLAHMAARQHLLASIQEKAVANSLRIVHFAFNSTQVSIPTAEASTLVEEAKVAPLVLLRGRTDGTADSSAESRIAQARANAVRDYLVASGVDPTRIRTTHQPSGDHLADNRNPQGRNLNRRVEIEVYRTLPVAQQATPQQP